MPGRLNRRRFVATAGAAAAGVVAGFAAPTILKASAADKWGDLTGRFVYDGPPPERKRLKVDKDLECSGRFDLRDESLMVAEDGGLANVYVYVRSRRVDVCPELEESADEQVFLDNRDCIFSPHCMTIWNAKQSYYIVNSDPVAQNVAFNPLGDVGANVVIPVGGDATWNFRRQQSVPVPIDCNYHPWERAYILPRDNPYAAVSEVDGAFRIPKLPVGDLEFQVWHERIGYLGTPEWERGRFERPVGPGVNDLGTIKIAPSTFEK
ncbi:MAG: cupredoxin domain-containing protein [Planctomycetota bacterium]